MSHVPHTSQNNPMSQIIKSQNNLISKTESMNKCHIQKSTAQEKSIIVQCKYRDIQGKDQIMNPDACAQIQTKN